MQKLKSFTKEKVFNKILELPIDDILPNPNQPRTDFDENDISKLAESIMQNGILQPLTVRKNDSGMYELIAGERRLRAAKMCGLKTVPCILKSISSRNSAILALVENIQREDLSFFDEAIAIRQLIDFYGMTQEDAALKLGRAQSTIANKLRLLKLTDEERNIIVKFNLTERHARALLKLSAPSDRISILEKVVKQNMNVETTEKFINKFLGRENKVKSYKKRRKVFQNVRIFINTINKAIETMQATGIGAISEKIEDEEFIEYRVRIPVNKS
jgi:ParB family chromosome partitioning protein